MKATLKLSQLSAYLPYQVQAKFKLINSARCKATTTGTVGAVYDNGTICCYDTVNATPAKFKLLLRPLSWIANEVLSDIDCDLLDEIEMKQFRDKQCSLNCLSYGVIQILLENHVDVFGLIEQGLAEEIKD